MSHVGVPGGGAPGEPEDVAAAIKAAEEALALETWIMLVNGVIGEDFYGFLMALMRNADEVNAAKLRAAWPAIWDELEERYHAPGGLLVGEKSTDGKMERREDGLYEGGELVRPV